MKLIFIVVLVGVLVGVLVLAMLMSPRHMVGMPVLQCGDIVFFSSKDQLLSRLYFQDIYFHVGIMIEPDVMMHYVNPLHIKDFGGVPLIASLCLSKMTDVYRSYGAGYVKVMRTGLEREDLMRAGYLVADGTTYDFDYMWSYILNRNDVRKLNCITFLGKLMERCGVLGKSASPVRDYVPGMALPGVYKGVFRFDIRIDQNENKK